MCNLGEVAHNVAAAVINLGNNVEEKGVDIIVQCPVSDKRVGVCTR